MNVDAAYVVIEEVFSSSFNLSYSDIKELCKSRIQNVDIFNKVFNLYEVVDEAAALYQGHAVKKEWLTMRGIVSQEDRRLFKLFYSRKCDKRASPSSYGVHYSLR